MRAFFCRFQLGGDDFAPLDVRVQTRDVKQLASTLVKVAELGEAEKRQGVLAACFEVRAEVDFENLELALTLLTVAFVEPGLKILPHLIHVHRDPEVIVELVQVLRRSIGNVVVCQAEGQHQHGDTDNEADDHGGFYTAYFLRAGLPVRRRHI